MVQDLARSTATDLIPQAVLCHVPGYTADGPSVRVARLYGGNVNASFRVDTGAGSFVVRLHRELGQELGADHVREAQLHAAAATAGLAPALVYVDADHRFLVMEYVSGALWIPDHFAQPERLAHLGTTLRALHAVKSPQVAPYDLWLKLRHLYHRLSEGIPAERGWFEQLMDRAMLALETSGTRQRPAVLIHNDLFHANIIGEERIYLLDWEYAAVADPLFDLACLFAHYPQATPYVDTLLDSSGLARIATPSMVRDTTWLYVLLSYFWYRSLHFSVPATPANQAAEQALLKRLG